MAFAESDVLANRDYFERLLRATKFKLDVVKRLKGEYEGEEFVLLDVRSRKGFIAGHIPGALCTPADDLEQLMPQLSREKEHVVYCWNDT